MTAQRGRDLLLKLAAEPGGAFATVGGLRTHGLALNAQTVDATHQESAGAWRTLLEGAGVRQASIRGAGVFCDAQSDAAVRDVFFSGAIRDWQVVVPDFGRITGPFQVAALEYAASHDGEITFELALESAGELTFEVL